MRPTVLIGLVLIAVFTEAFAATLEVKLSGSSGQSLADGAVYVEAPAATARPTQHASVAQRQRVFDPFVTIVQKGTSIFFPNEDEILHNVYSISPAKRFDLRLYRGKPPEPVVFDTAGVVTLGCNVHDWMLAHILVVDTPYFAKTGADGVARIADVPPGNYVLFAWYPGMRAPTRVRELTVAARDRERIDLSLPTASRTRPRAPPFDPMKY